MINLDDIANRLVPADPMKNEYTQGITVGVAITIELVKDLLARNMEPLTDKEQRIFLAAMGRELIICKETDKECRNCREAYEDSLAYVCHEIERKVKAAFWIKKIVENDI